MKNQRGVTLIALVVTIIVLIILAGVAIAALLGDNGVITRSRQAKRNQIEGEVRDTISLAVQAAKMEAERRSAESSDGFFADVDLKSGSVLTTLLAKELKPVAASAGANGYYVDTTTEGVLKITYSSDDYKQATNDKTAKIECQFTVDDNKFALDTTFNSGSGWKYTPAIAD
jgi:type II secretory pathway pseudopilin PulG